MKQQVLSSLVPPHVHRPPAGLAFSIESMELMLCASNCDNSQGTSQVGAMQIMLYDSNCHLLSSIRPSDQSRPILHSAINMPFLLCLW